MRKCSECGQMFQSGYCVGDGFEYYCSDPCLHKHFTEEEWNECYNEDGGYYSEWDITDCHEDEVIESLADELDDAISFLETFEDDEMQGEEFQERINRKRRLLELVRDYLKDVG